MNESEVIIDNQMAFAIECHVEPECTRFDIMPGKAAIVSCKYHREPLRIQLSQGINGLFCAVFPGDGDVLVRVDGETIEG